MMEKDKCKGNRASGTKKFESVTIECPGTNECFQITVSHGPGRGKYYDVECLEKMPPQESWGIYGYVKIDKV
jgi:hypothetical protein